MWLKSRTQKETKIMNKTVFFVIFYDFFTYSLHHGHSKIPSDKTLDYIWRPPSLSKLTPY